VSLQPASSKGTIVAANQKSRGEDIIHLFSHFLQASPNTQEHFALGGGRHQPGASSAAILDGSGRLAEASISD
jgi:hypothetical protein